MNNFPSVSIIIPTLNSESVLEGCLKSIIDQNYPKKKLEILIADGGSVDKTVEIAKKYGARVYKNPLVTSEAGKAVCLKHSNNELIASIDSDNVLPEENWLRRMVEPFVQKNIEGSEPWEYTYRENDGIIDRYCALMGLNDPFCYFVGNYDRLNTLSGKWTGLKMKEKDKGSWIEVCFDPSDFLPTIGANGIILRRSTIEKITKDENYFFDIDILTELIKQKPIFFAKVKVGIVHLYCGSDIGKFMRKQRRRVRDFLFFEKKGARHYPWFKKSKLGVFKFVFSSITIFPLLTQSLFGYLIKKDRAWFFHPIACWLTLYIYSKEYFFSLIKPVSINRAGWKQ